LIVNEYPVWEYSSYSDAYVALWSDVDFVFLARRATRAFLAGQTEPVWRYVFSHVPDNATPEVRAHGAVHGADTPYVFDTLDRGGYVVSDGERQLIDLVQKIWSRLAATGTLEADDLPIWPRYNGLDPYLRLDTPVAAETGFRTGQCDFWDYMQLIKPY
jgi:carboxylesterase type B